MQADRRTPFGIALRQFREASGLSQEQLAERAGLSLRGVSDLERGVRTTPRLETVRMLADGLGLDERNRTALIAARNSVAQATNGQERKRSGRLPIPPTSFVGRTEEIAAVIDEFENRGTRLITLVGTGGIGKTRIAIEVAHRLAGRFADEAVFVDLSPIRDADLVIGAIADAFGVHQHGGNETRDMLSVALSDRSLLLVLDNLEQVIDSAVDIAFLLDACPGLTVLVTSRVVLRLTAEHVMAIEPLILPASDDVQSSRESDAVTLFLARARAVDHRFSLDEDNSAAIAALVVRLQGIPLAIELAAARVRLLSIPALLSRLESQLPLLAGGAKDGPARHRTMRDTILWSYDLLSLKEQAVFRSLAIFPDGCTLETATALLRADNRFSEVEALDAIESLVDGSILRLRKGCDGQVRYRMLQSLQEFGLEQLGEKCEEVTVRQTAYTCWCVPLVRDSEFVLSTTKPELWLDCVEAEYQNLRAQAEWFISREAVEDALEIAIALATYSSIRGHLEDSRRLLELLLAHPRLEEPRAARMRGLTALGIVCKYQADSKRSYDVLRESAQIARELDQHRYIPFALYNLGIASADIGREEDAEALFNEVVSGRQAITSTFPVAAAYRKLARIAENRGQTEQSHRFARASLNLSLAEGQTWNLALAQLFLGEQLLHRGDLVQAERLTLEARAQMERVGNRSLIPYLLSTLATIHVQRKDFDCAEAFLKEALDLARDLGIIREIAFLFCELGHIACLRDDGDLAKILALRAIEWTERSGEVFSVVRCLDLAVDVALLNGDAPRATWYLGAFEAVSAEHGLLPVGDEANRREQRVNSTKARLGERLWQVHHDRGLAMPERVMLPDIKSWLSCHIPGDTSSIGSGQTAQSDYDNGTR